MLMPLLGNLQQSQPLARDAQGVVVDNKDPDGLKRIKVKYPTIYETQDNSRIPWSHATPSPDGGGRGDSSGSEVPEVGSSVVGNFPTRDIYSCYYSSRQITPQSSSSIFGSNTVPQAPDSELHIPNGSTNSPSTDTGSGSFGDVGGSSGSSDGYGDGGNDSGVVADASATHNMHGKVWTNLAESNKKSLSWSRHDKNQGVSEHYQGSGKDNNGAPGGGLFRHDRSGNVQMHVPGNLDIVVRGNYTTTTMKDHTHKTMGNHYADTGGDHVSRTGGSHTAKISGDHDVEAGGNSGHKSGGMHGHNASQIMQNSGYQPGTVATKDGEMTTNLSKLDDRNSLLDQKLTALNQQHDDAKQSGDDETSRLKDLASSWQGNATYG